MQKAYDKPLPCKPPFNKVIYIVSEKLHTSRGRRKDKKTANNKIVTLMRREKQTNTTSTLNLNSNKSSGNCEIMQMCAWKQICGQQDGFHLNVFFVCGRHTQYMRMNQCWEYCEYAWIYWFTSHSAQSWQYHDRRKPELGTTRTLIEWLQGFFIVHNTTVS